MSDFLSRYEPRDLDELERIALPILMRTLKGSDISKHAATHAGIIAARFFGTVWAAPDVCQVVEGRAGLTAEAQRAVVLRSGVCTYEIVEESDNRVCIRFVRKDVGEYTADWTIARAEKAGYRTPPKDGKKPSKWYTEPVRMLRARCWTEARSQLFPDIVGDNIDAAVSPEEIESVQREAETAPAFAPRFGGVGDAPPVSAPAPRNEPAPAAPADTDAGEAVTPFEALKAIMVACGWVESLGDEAARDAGKLTRAFCQRSPDAVQKFVDRLSQRDDAGKIEDLGKFLEKQRAFAAHAAAQAQPAPAPTPEPAATPAPAAEPAPVTGTPRSRVSGHVDAAEKAGLVMVDHAKMRATVKAMAVESCKSLADDLDASTDDKAKHVALLTTITGIRKAA